MAHYGQKSQIGLRLTNNSDTSSSYSSVIQKQKNIKMALLSTCLCCSLLTASIFFGITSMVLYLMSFGIELWWIIEAEVRLPIPAYLLALSFFFLSLLSFSMVVGLRTKRTRLLLAWILLNLLLMCPEAGMVLFMAIYYWEGKTYAIIEVGLWILRIFISVFGLISTQSLYSRWRDQKSVLKSLSGLNVTNDTFLPNGIGGEYQAKQIEAGFGYQNTAYAYSQPHLSTLAVTKYAPSSTVQPKYLKRSASSASQFVSASRLSGLNEIPPMQLNASQLTGYQKNEFDTSKFATGLVYRNHSQYDLPSFGLDPDEPIFVNGQYGRGGLQHQDYYQRPFSAMSGSKGGPNWRPERPDSSLQWYKPRSLVNLEDDTSSIWSGIGKSGNYPSHNTQSLDRRKYAAGAFDRAHSVGALNFGYNTDDGILRGSVAPFMHFAGNAPASESKQSLGQFSDHIDKYRDVAL